MEIKEAMEILEKDIHTEVPKAAISARSMMQLCEWLSLRWKGRFQ